MFASLGNRPLRGHSKLIKNVSTYSSSTVFQIILPSFPDYLPIWFFRFPHPSFYSDSKLSSFSNIKRPLCKVINKNILLIPRCMAASLFLAVLFVFRVLLDLGLSKPTPRAVQHSLESFVLRTIVQIHCAFINFASAPSNK